MNKWTVGERKREERGERREEERRGGEERRGEGTGGGESDVAAPRDEQARAVE
jgi:hypothetical protein